jgi:hypothetical protein
MNLARTVAAWYLCSQYLCSHGTCVRLRAARSLNPADLFGGSFGFLLKRLPSFNVRARFGGTRGA